MRLITKTTLLYLALALLVFSVGGLITYQQVRKQVQNETDYALAAQLKLTVTALQDGTPPTSLVNKKVAIELVPVPVPKEQSKRPTFTDTLAMHYQLDRMEPQRKATITREVDGQWYRISVTDVFIELADLSDGVFKTMLRLFIFLGIAFLLFGFLIQNWLLKPFQSTLQRIRNFTLTGKDKLDLPKTSTREFTELNHFIKQMADKARQDYRSLKEFSENASHEMQTPLAIAQGKLELLMAGNQLTEDQLQLIQEAKDSIARISKLGQSLSLLTKIENREFTAEQAIDLSACLKTAIQRFQDLFDLRGIRLESHIEKGVQVRIDPDLAEIAINNLLKNALHHNLANGWAKVNLDQNSLEISNSGMEPSIPPEQLFERFKKGNQSGGSLGLGLTLVKKVCDTYNYPVHYTFKNKTHTLTIDF